MSLYQTVPATAKNPGTITAALALHSRDASRILRAAGYRIGAKARPGAKHWAGALAAEPPGSEIYRAAWRLLCVRQCRESLTAGDAAGASWAAYVLAETYGRDVVDALETPVRKDANRRHARQLSPGRGLAKGVEELAKQERETRPGASAKELWTAIRARVKAAGNDWLQVQGCTILPLREEPAPDELVQIDARGRRRIVTFSAFKNRYAGSRLR